MAETLLMALLSTAENTKLTAVCEVTHPNSYHGCIQLHNFFLNLIIFAPGVEPATVNLVQFGMVEFFFGVFVFLVFWLVVCLLFVTHFFLSM